MPKDSGMGAAIKRREDARFLLGSGRYSDDITLLNQTHAIFVRSEVANGEINSIDTSAVSYTHLTLPTTERV